MTSGRGGGGGERDRKNFRLRLGTPRISNSFPAFARPVHVRAHVGNNVGNNEVPVSAGLCRSDRFPRGTRDGPASLDKTDRHAPRIASGILRRIHARPVQFSFDHCGSTVRPSHSVSHTLSSRARNTLHVARRAGEEEPNERWSRDTSSSQISQIQPRDRCETRQTGNRHEY